MDCGQLITKSANDGTFRAWLSLSFRRPYRSFGAYLVVFVQKGGIFAPLQIRVVVLAPLDSGYYQLAILFSYLFQCSKARENEPPVLLTRPSVPTSRLGFLRQKVEVNRRKNAHNANTRNKRANVPKRKEGSQRRRKCCTPHRGLFNLYSKAHVWYSSRKWNRFFLYSKSIFLWCEVLKVLKKKRTWRGQSRAEKEKSPWSGQRRSHLCPRIASFCDGTYHLKKTRRRRQWWVGVNHNILPCRMNHRMIKILMFSELRIKKLFLLLTKNQLSPSLAGRFEAEERWYFQINSSVIGVCIFLFKH